MQASFAPQNFQRETVSAWLNFYALSFVNKDAARLLEIYRSRLRSNLIVALRGLSDHPERTAETLGALIDGVYLRAVLTPGPTDADASMNIVMSYLEETLK